jgi:hypothetical protein
MSSYRKLIFKDKISNYGFYPLFGAGLIFVLIEMLSGGAPPRIAFFACHFRYLFFVNLHWNHETSANLHEDIAKLKSEKLRGPRVL